MCKAVFPCQMKAQSMGTCVRQLISHSVTDGRSVSPKYWLRGSYLDSFAMICGVDIDEDDSLSLVPPKGQDQDVPSKCLLWSYLGTAQELIPNASSMYLQWVLTVLSVMTSQEEISSHHNYSKSKFYDLIYINQNYFKGPAHP